MLAMPVLLALLVLSMASVHAAMAESVSVYIPDDMIAGLEYEGMLLADVPDRTPRTIRLASDGPPVAIPDAVTVPAGQNHALFRIAPAEAASGTLTIHALAPQQTITAQSTICLLYTSDAADE